MARDDVLRAGAAVPSGMLRVGFVVSAAAAATTLFPLVGWQVIMIALAVLAATVPSTLAAWATIVCLPVALLLDELSLWRACVAVGAAHLLHVLGSLTLAVPVRARVTLRALAPTARRFLLVQLSAQAMTVLTLTFLPRTEGTAGEGWWAVAGAAALLALCALVVRTGKRTDART